LRRAPFKYEDEFLELLSDICKQFADRLGPLAQRLEALDQPLAVTLTALQQNRLQDKS
jgi:LysR family nitrogen assimilation transcriptional regulator